MYTIEEKPFGPLTEYRILNIDSGEFVSVLPEFGALMNQVGLRKGDHVFELLDGCKDYAELITEGRAKFKGSKLFPFPNRINHGEYIFENSTYRFPVNFPHEKNSIHGIVLEQKFHVIKKLGDIDRGLLSVQYETSGQEEGYPFKVLLTIDFILARNGFTCTTTIQNIDHKNIPIGEGWHPYFKTGSKMDDCYLKLPVEKSFEVDDRMIPNGKVKQETIFNSLSRIGTTNFDTGFKLQPSDSQKSETVLQDLKKNIAMHIWQEAGEGGYNYLQVYIPPDRQSIAIEPMSCLADAFNNHEGLLVLHQGEKRNFSFGIMLE